MLGLSQALPCASPARIPIEWGHQPFASNYQNRKLGRRGRGGPPQTPLPRSAGCSARRKARASPPATSQRPAGILGRNSGVQSQLLLGLPASPNQWVCWAQPPHPMWAPRGLGGEQGGGHGEAAAPRARTRWLGSSGPTLPCLDLPLGTLQRAIRLPEVLGGCEEELTVTGEIGAQPQARPGPCCQAQDAGHAPERLPALRTRENLPSTRK